VNVIGLGHLTAFAGKHPKSASTLWALHALIAGAEWRSAEDASAQLGCLLRELPGGHWEIATRTPPRLRLTLQVNYSLSLVRIHAVEAMPDEDKP
jgi:hypothetical protein